MNQTRKEAQERFSGAAFGSLTNNPSPEYLATLERSVTNWLSSIQSHKRMVEKRLWETAAIK